jgi:hypothetical protein
VQIRKHLFVIPAKAGIQQDIEKPWFRTQRCHSRESGNPQAVGFTETGFPIKTSGMTIKGFFNTLLGSP